MSGAPVRGMGNKSQHSRTVRQGRKRAISLCEGRGTEVDTHPL